MRLWAVVGVVVVLVILLDAFETIVLPRRVSRRLRLARLVLRPTWALWAAPARRPWRSGQRREAYLSFFGPFALMLLLGVWAVALVGGFALLLWSLGPAVVTTGGETSFGTALYGSGTTFFTLGLGDVTPRTTTGRVLIVLEAGMGFAFLALMIAYVPVLYQAFSQREINVSLLDARAGSPPSAVELLHRHAGEDLESSLGRLLMEWERWSAELLESHLSYPILAYYRSQHERQSWLAGLTTILDVSALIIVGIVGVPSRPARLAFAMARHAAADLSEVLGTRPQPRDSRPLSALELAEMRALLARDGLALRDGPEADRKLARLRQMYEPFVAALADRLLMPLPRWTPTPGARDDWQITAWGTEQWSVTHDEVEGA